MIITTINIDTRFPVRRLGVHLHHLNTYRQSLSICCRNQRRLTQRTSDHSGSPKSGRPSRFVHLPLRCCPSRSLPHAACVTGLPAGPAPTQPMLMIVMLMLKMVVSPLFRITLTMVRWKLLKGTGDCWSIVLTERNQIQKTQVYVCPLAVEVGRYSYCSRTNGHCPQ